MRKQGDLMSVAADLFSVARLLAAADRPADATAVLARSQAIYEEIGAAIPTYDQEDTDELTERIRAALPAGDYERAQERGRTLADDEVDALLDELVADLT